MIQFKVSAPGSLSLFGELMVKYGKPGLTAGIDLRTMLTFTELSDHIIQLEFPQIRLFLSVPLEQFVAFCCHCESDMKLLHEHVLQLIVSNPHFYSTEDQRTIVQVFFYLLVYLTHVEKIKTTAFRVELFTELMVNTDFVCLTPSTVCLTACFLHWSHLQSGGCPTFSDHDLRNIRSYAAQCEGISRKIGLAGVTACTYGSIIQHRTTDDYTSVNWFAKTPCETVLLVDSGHTPNPEHQMQRLADVVNVHPVAASLISGRIDFATNMASNVFRRLGAVRANDDESNDEEQRLTSLLEHHILMTAIDLNQRLLQLLNVSHYYLDEICLIARKHGMYGKYTDIGNGRYAYIWCEPHISKRRIMFLSQELMARRFGVVVTSFARCGVKIE